MFKTDFIIIKRTAFAIMSMICMAMMIGCMSNNIVIDAIHSWEGHYLTSESAQDAIKQIDLKKGESVWILSDKTLNRVLKNVQN